MLQSTTILCETATVVGVTGSTAKTAAKYEVNEKGEKVAVLVNKKRALIGTALASTASSATYGYQQHGLNNIVKGVHNAQAYVDSLSAEQLAELSAMLDDKQVEFEIVDSPELGEAKQPYTKK